MQLNSLHSRYDTLQAQFGDVGLHTAYGTGETNSPKVCFVFMNPTSKNISTSLHWTGLRAPWLGTKNVWKLFNQIGILRNGIYKEIQEKKSAEWDNDFCNKVYGEIKKSGYFITNLAKCTKIDASPISNTVFKQYRNVMLEEIRLLNPKIIITFGNQVSSILLGKNTNVSANRKESQDLLIEGVTYKVFPVFYPVGQGMRNIGKAIEDIQYILGLAK